MLRSIIFWTNKSLTISFIQKTMLGNKPGWCPGTAHHYRSRFFTTTTITFQNLSIHAQTWPIFNTNTDAQIQIQIHKHKNLCDHICSNSNTVHKYRNLCVHIFPCSNSVPAPALGGLGQSSARGCLQMIYTMKFMMKFMMTFREGLSVQISVENL